MRSEEPLKEPLRQILLRQLILRDAQPARLLAHSRDLDLVFAQTRQDVDLADRGPEGAVVWVPGPREGFPDGVEEDDEREGDVGGEEGFGVGGTANGLGLC